MGEIILKGKEAVCRRCEKPHMEVVENPELISFFDGEMLKARVQCRTCGRVSYIIREIN
jgi:ribosomal protein L37E